MESSHKEDARRKVQKNSQHKSKASEKHKSKDKVRNENSKSVINIKVQQHSDVAPITSGTTSNDHEGGVINVLTTSNFAKRELTSNWAKYEEVPDVDNNEQLNAADFENLLTAPPSVGSHFVFSTEKQWENSESASQYFKLNLVQLSQNILSIPFYERQGYAQDLFSEKELDEMNAKARARERPKAVSEVPIVSTSSVSEPNIVQVTKPNVFTVAAKEETKSKNIVNVKTDTIETALEETKSSDDELDALLEFGKHSETKKLCMSALKIHDSLSGVSKAIKTSPDKMPSASYPQAHCTQQTQSTNEMQQWLDDIFDE